MVGGLRPRLPTPNRRVPSAQSPKAAPPTDPVLLHPVHIPSGLPMSRYIRATRISTNAGVLMRQMRFSHGLVPVASFHVACAEPQTTAPANVANLAASAQQLAAPPACEHVSGAFVFTTFQFTSQTTAVGAGTLQGDLSGGFSAEYFDIEQRGSGVIQMRAHHTITRSTGTIRTSDDILLLPDQDPTLARPNSQLEVIGGTGRYAGATGLLHTHGQLNLATLAGSLQYKGQVCVA